jgi:hypothetical protein
MQHGDGMYYACGIRMYILDVDGLQHKVLLELYEVI